MQSPFKTPKKGAVARLRESYKNMRKQPILPELKESLKDQKSPKEQPSDQKKIARSAQDAELP